MKWAEEKHVEFLADAKAFREYQFKYKAGDRLKYWCIRKNQWVNVIIRDYYIDNGIAKYTVYLPGMAKKGLDFWCFETDLFER